jgi:hypothetical protein
MYTVTVGVEYTEEELVSLLTIPCSTSWLSRPRLSLAAEGMLVRVVLVLLVLKTVGVTGIYEVTAFFALTVTVGPAGIVVYKMDVVVDAFGVLVLTLVVGVVVVWVTTTEGEGAVNCCKNVEVLLSVVVLPFGVEVKVEI